MVDIVFLPLFKLSTNLGTGRRNKKILAQDKNYNQSSLLES